MSHIQLIVLIIFTSLLFLGAIIPSGIYMVSEMYCPHNQINKNIFKGDIFKFNIINYNNMSISTLTYNITYCDKICINTLGIIYNVTSGVYPNRATLYKTCQNIINYKNYIEVSLNKIHLNKINAQSIIIFAILVSCYIGSMIAIIYYWKKHYSNDYTYINI